MARDLVTVYLPEQEVTQSVESIVVTKTTVDPDNGCKIANAFDNKNNSLVIVVEPTSGSDGVVTFVAGDAYPNAMLGDLSVTPTVSKANIYMLDDLARFENKDGSLYVDFGDDFEGTIFAVAKRAGLQPTE